MPRQEVLESIFDNIPVPVPISLVVERILSPKVKEKERQFIIESLFDAVWREYDLYNLVFCIYLVTDRRVPKEYRRVLDLLEQHFQSETGFTYKAALPHPRLEKPTSLEYGKALTRMTKGLLRTSKLEKYPQLWRFLKKVEDATGSLKANGGQYDDSFSAVFTIDSRNPVGIAAFQPIQDVQEFFNEIFNIVYGLREDSTDARVPNQRLLDFIAAIKQQAQSKDIFKAAGIKDFYTRKYGGTSLKELLTVTDREDFCQLFLQYLAGSPEGDFVWFQLIQLFFTVPLYEDSNPPHDPEGYLEKFMEFQYWLAENLFLGSSDPDFDRLFLTFLQRGNQARADYIAWAIAAASISRTQILHQFHPEYKLHELLNRSSLTMAAVQHLPPHLVGANMFFHDDVVTNLLRETDILPNLRTRLETVNQEAFSGKVFLSLELFLRELNDVTPHLLNPEERAQRMFETTQDKVGREFLEKLAQRHQELETLTALIAEDCYQNISYWPPAHTVNRIYFSQKSFAAELGFGLVTFVVDTLAEEAPEENFPRCDFFLQGKDGSGIAFQGHFDEQGNYHLESHDFSSLIKDDYLAAVYKMLIQNIVTASFKDIITRNRRSSKKVKQKSVEVREINSDALSKELENHAKKERGFTVVGSHKKYLAGEAAVDLYLLSLHEYEEALEENPVNETKVTRIVKDLKIARSFVQQISQVKQENIPSVFALHTVYDPSIDEYVTLQTWVKTHTRPHQEDPVALTEWYEKVFRAGSAIKMLALIREIGVAVYDLDIAETVQSLEFEEEDEVDTDAEPDS